MKEEEVSPIFANVEELMHVHCEFLSVLDQRIAQSEAEDEEVAVGEMFLALV